MSRFILVINGDAGTVQSLGAEHIADTARTVFSGSGHDLEIVITDGAALVEALNADRAVDALIIAGGDGTIRTAAEVALRRNLLLGTLPMGTMNLLACDLGIPPDLAAACKVMCRAKEERIDIVRINGELCLNAAIIGPLTDLVDLREGIRHGGGIPAIKDYLFGACKALATGRVPFVMKLGRLRRAVQTKMLIISNNQFTGLNRLRVSRLSLKSGRCAIYVASHRSAWKLIASVLRMLSVGAAVDGSKLKIYRTRNASIHCLKGAQRIAIDGELVELEDPLIVRVYPKSLRIIRA